MLLRAAAGERHSTEVTFTPSRRRRILAFLGPNGAGKSTTLSMLTTLLQPTSGSATVAGQDICAEPAAVRRSIGYTGQGNSAGHTQRVRDELVVQGRCYGLGRRAAGDRSDGLLASLDLESLGTRVVSSLSGGQRRRLDVALGMALTVADARTPRRWPTPSRTGAAQDLATADRVVSGSVRDGASLLPGLLVAPLGRPSLLIGRALKEIVPVVAQAVLIIVVTVPFGFRPEPAGIVIGLVMVSILGVGLGALSYALAVASKGEDWIFWTVQQTLLFPLMLLSGILLPIDGGPAWIRALSKCNPLTYVVRAMRVLFDGRVSEAVVLQGFAAAAGVCLLGLVVGIRVMGRGTAG